jgi:Protein of unknown function (DUF2795)
MADESKLRECVKDSTFPASIESILRSAREHHCSMSELVELTHLPARQYGSADDVVSQVTSGRSLS